MARTIQGAAVYRPGWRCGAVPVEGPDEDAFTMCVAALEGLARPPNAASSSALATVHVAGASWEGAGWEVPEAVGAPAAEVRRHGTGLAGLLEALVAAQEDALEGTDSAVVAVDLAGPSEGDRSAPFQSEAIAVAFRLSEGPGLRVVRHGVRVAGPRGRHHAWALLELVGEAVGRDPPGSASLRVYALDRPVPVPPAPLLERWDLVVRPAGPGAVIPAAGATGAYALALAEVAAEGGPPALAGLYEVGPHRDVFGVLRRGGAPVPRVELGGPREGLERTSEAVRLARGPAPDARSEGAYLPFPRYAEGLPSRWRLEGERCARCHRLTFPARGACRGCGASDRLELEKLPRDGAAVEAVTTVGEGAQPTEFDRQVAERGAYSVAILRVADATRVTLQVTDARAGELRVGQSADTVLRRLYPAEGAWRYGLKAAPARTAAPGSSGR